MIVRLAAALIVTTTWSAQAEEADQFLQRGETLAKEICAPCHAIGAAGQSPHPSAPPFRRLGDRLDLDDLAERLREGIIAGHPDMPTVRFSREDARALVAYLRSIQSAR